MSLKYYVKTLIYVIVSGIMACYNLKAEIFSCIGKYLRIISNYTQFGKNRRKIKNEDEAFISAVGSDAGDWCHHHDRYGRRACPC